MQGQSANNLPYAKLHTKHSMNTLFENWFVIAGVEAQTSWFVKRSEEKIKSFSR